MRIRLEHNGTVFEYERHPLPERRFRTLAAAGAYVGLALGVTALCGVPGLAAVLISTVVVLLVDKGMM